MEAVTGSNTRISGGLYGDVIDLSGVTVTGVTLIDGWVGDDIVIGSAGDDRIALSFGRDVLTGGAGADVFLLDDERNSPVSYADTITDFVAGTDRLDVSGVDAKVNVRGEQAFAFIGTAAFSGAAGELRYEVSGGVTHVYGDYNGDRAADFQVDLTGALTLAASDFVL